MISYVLLVYFLEFSMNYGRMEEYSEKKSGKEMNPVEFLCITQDILPIESEGEKVFRTITWKHLTLKCILDHSSSGYCQLEMNDISEKACSVDIYLIRFSEYDLLPFSLKFFVYVWMPVYIPVFFEDGKDYEGKLI